MQNLMKFLRTVLPNAKRTISFGSKSPQPNSSTSAFHGNRNALPGSSVVPNSRFISQTSSTFFPSGKTKFQIESEYVEKFRTDQERHVHDPHKALEKTLAEYKEQRVGIVRGQEIFVSHSHANIETFRSEGWIIKSTEVIVAALRAAGYNVLFDLHCSVGGKNPNLFMSKILTADHVILFGSRTLLHKHTHGGYAICSEINLIDRRRFELGKTFIPIIISGTLREALPPNFVGYSQGIVLVDDYLSYASLMRNTLTLLEFYSLKKKATAEFNTKKLLNSIEEKNRPLWNKYLSPQDFEPLIVTSSELSLPETANNKMKTLASTLVPNHPLQENRQTDTGYTVNIHSSKHRVVILYHPQEKESAKKIIDSLKADNEVDMLDFSDNKLDDTYELYLANAQRVVILISESFLKSFQWMRILILLISMRKDALQIIRPILMPCVVDGDNSIVNGFMGSIFYIEFWSRQQNLINARILQKQDELRALNSVNRMENDISLRDLYDKSSTIHDLILNVQRFLNWLITLTNINQFTQLAEGGFNELCQRLDINRIDELVDPADESIQIFRHIFNTHPTIDIKRPRFPADAPRFPATESKTYTLPNGLSVIIKNESENPTGTHKDRFALEVVDYYAKAIEATRATGGRLGIRKMSLITSGCAGVAIQMALKRKENLPNLKVLVDKFKMNSTMKNLLRELGCELYEADLSKTSLSSKDILQLTENSGGIDLTDRTFLDPSGMQYYDWLSYEILNNPVDYIFVPFGTGDLFSNILNICQFQKVQGSRASDPRLNRQIDDFSKLRFFGATTNSPTSSMDKLYANFNPSAEKVQSALKTWIDLGACHPDSQIVNVQESWVQLAIEYAKELNIPGEPSGLAGLALYLQLLQDGLIPRDARVCIVNTGKLKTESINILIKTSPIFRNVTKVDDAKNAVNLVPHFSQI